VLKATDRRVGGLFHARRGSSGHALESPALSQVQGCGARLTDVPPAAVTTADLVAVGDCGRRDVLGRTAAERDLDLRADACLDAAVGGGLDGAAVVLDATGCGLGAAAAQVGRLRAAGAGPVIVVCEEPRPRELRAALLAGAAGIVLAAELEEVLGPCLDAVRVGQVCTPLRHARQLEPPALSARERQVLGLVVMGHTNSEIAGLLFLAESTVKSHLSSAFAKLGVRSRSEAVDVILDSERGSGVGILGISVEQVL
jgi:DNA-binding NarL/FixJ family response regulator